MYLHLSISQQGEMRGRGACVTGGGMCGGGGVCVEGETTSEAGGRHPTGMHSCTLKIYTHNPNS